MKMSDLENTKIKKNKKEKKPEWATHSYRPIQVGDLVTLQERLPSAGVGIVIRCIPANAYESSSYDICWSTGVHSNTSLRQLRRLCASHIIPPRSQE